MKNSGDYHGGATLLIAILFTACSALLKENRGSLRSGSEYLDDNGNYELTWNIWSNDTIVFQVRAKTTGYVGLGLSTNGDMTGADIFIGGVYANGTNYSSDRHATGRTTPVEDEVSNYELKHAIETATHTTISFERALNTCDDKDYPITDETVHVIWAMGETDVINYHGGTRRGTKSLNFYGTNNNFNPEIFEKLDLVTNFTMPSQHTSYMCTFHKAPPLNQTHHIVAFEAILDNALARQHTHHFVIYKCKAPVGEDPDEYFGRFVGQDGRHCYDFAADPKEFPFQNCITNYVYIWSKGGKRLLFENDIGFPIPDPDRIGKAEYYAMEVHYDNPEELANLSFETGGRIYHTDKLREKEAGLLVIDHTIGPQLTVPPFSNAFVLPGHCSSECTNKFIPDDGITIFNNLFHSHLQGRKMRLRHFRKNKELPWVDVDNHYDFNFQQNKNLKTPVKILKGDQLTVECTFDTSGNKDGKAVIGGLSTKEEMCEAIVFYYPRQNFSVCGSRQNITEHFQIFGISNYTEKNSSFSGGMPEYDVIEPAELAGDYLDSISKKFNWTAEFRERYQKAKMGEQDAWCYGSLDDILENKVSYPDNFQPYEPKDECAAVK